MKRTKRIYKKEINGIRAGYQNAGSLSKADCKKLFDFIDQQNSLIQQMRPKTIILTMAIDRSPWEVMVQRIVGYSWKTAQEGCNVMLRDGPSVPVVESSDIISAMTLRAMFGKSKKANAS